MKNSIITIALLFVTLICQAQVQSPMQFGQKPSKICIKSTKALLYDSRSQKSDTIYTSIQRWSYDTTKSTYSASISDYIKIGETYKNIDSKTKSFTKIEVDGLFTALSNSILPTESYTAEMDKLLTMSLLLDTKNNLMSDGKTVYGGTPADWVVIIP